MNSREYYLSAGKQLALAGIENAQFDARQILRHVTGLSDAGLLAGGGEITAEQQEKVDALLQKRKSGFPLQYLLGEWEFYGLSFAVGEGVLIPRQDTELLCDVAVDFMKSRRGGRLIDLCSGTGCIAVVLEQHCPDTQGYAMECSPDALRYLSANLARHHSAVTMLADDVLCPQSRETGFDLITCNPPYLTDADMGRLQKEVTFEPASALLAQDEGQHYYKVISGVWKNRLNQGGMLAYEVGIHQADAVQEIMRQNGFYDIRIHQDLCGIDRVVSGLG